MGFSSRQVETGSGVSRGAAIAGAAASVLTLATLVAVARVPIEVPHGSLAWTRIVRGPTADGILYPGARALIALPDLPRSHAREVVLDGVSLGGPPAVLSVSVDGAIAVKVAVDGRRPATVAIPAARHRGLRLDITAERGAPPARLRGVTVGGAWPPPVLLLVVVLLCALVAAGAATVETLDARASIGLALVAAGCSLLLFTAMTGALAAGLSGVSTGAAVVLIAAGIAGAARLSRTSRIALARAGLLVAAVSFGAGARWIFAPSAGSWDMEYWRAWTESAIARGVTGAYGPPLAPGAFIPTLRGDEPLWMVSHEGRQFPIDYPPLAIAAWRAAASWIEPTDASSWNVALKLPALAGDLLAVAILVWWWPGGRSGARAAALYWAIPPSWLSSATLGYLDGAYAPFVLAAAVASASGRAGLAGGALAVAALIKPTALVAAPAIAVALLAPRRIVSAAAAGLGVVAVALLPLAVAGTLGTAIAHIVPILYQERLSGGYANVWWLLGAAVSGETAPVPYVRIDSVLVPVRALGVAAFAAAATLICLALARTRGTTETVAASAALFAAYGVLAVGVHVNHPHPMVLLFVAAGMAAWRWPAVALIAGYAVNILLLEQLGRIAGPRYGPLDGASDGMGTIRSGLGFDLTVPLAMVHLVALTALLLRPARMQVVEHARTDQT